MIESPLIQELIAQEKQKDLRIVLEARFDAVPPEIVRHIQSISDVQLLTELVRFAVQCPDLKAFRLRLQP
jgi:hypothetical protein